MLQFSWWLSKPAFKNARRLRGSFSCYIGGKMAHMATLDAPLVHQAKHEKFQKGESAFAVLDPRPRRGKVVDDCVYTFDIMMD